MRLNIKRLVYLFVLVASPLTLPLANSQGTEGKVLTLEEIERDLLPELEKLKRANETINRSDRAKSALERLQEIQGQAIRSANPAHPSSRISTVRQWATRYIENLPDFVCIQFNQNYVASKYGEWRKYHEAVAQVQFVDGQENYKTLNVNGLPSEENWKKASGGMFGSFGSVLSHMFSPGSPSRFSYLNTEELKGWPVDVFSVVNSSGYTLHKGVKRNGKLKGPVLVGYEGKVYVDKASPAVMRVVFNRLINVPSKFPIQDATLQIDYGPVTIAGIRHWLPIETLIVVIAKPWVTKFHPRTQYYIVWTDYKRFGAETKLTFD